MHGSRGGNQSQTTLKTMKIGNSDMLISKVGYRYLSVAFQGISMVLGVDNIVFSDEELEEEQAVGMLGKVVAVGSFK